MPVTKLSDNTFKVVTQAEAPAPVEQTYDIVFLYSQKARIIADANSYLAARQAELDNVQSLIDQAKAAGITAPAMPEPLVDAEVATPKVI